ncbi:MAG: class I SAM-dependent methyltransferase [Bacteroidales bacterium]|nr:class I SAM-dependent methyltransferase [Bacteroidales bacterium]
MTNYSKTKEFIRQHADADVKKLALQAGKFPDIDMPFVIRQIAGRKAIADKIPSWFAVEDLLFPHHLSLEQCSSEATARYKASLVGGDSLIDLTGGFGIDCAFMAANFKRVTYLERNPELCEIARNNFPLLNLNRIEIHNADSVDFFQETERVDCIFIDPARRNEHGGKTVLVSDCEPNVSQLTPLLLSKAKRVMIKLSPMLDLSLALEALPQTTAVHIVSVNNECKELILILKNGVVSEVPITCVNITKNGMQLFSFTKKEEQESLCEYTSDLGTFLYEPNASLMKGGAYKAAAARFGLKKLHPNSHLYTSNTRCNDFPGRIFAVETSFSLNKNELKSGLNGIKQANLTIRNFPTSVAELRKRLKLSDGGNNYLFATTLADERKVLVKCVKG